MKKLLVLIIISSAVIFACSFVNSQSKSHLVQTAEDSLDAERKKFYDEVMASVKGKESMRADSVFKNLKLFDGSSPLTTLKVSHLTGIMLYWGKAIGVSCTYCHNTNDWASDEKREKLVARDMYNLRQTINGQLLKNIANLQSQSPKINCGTCHRGKPIPKE